jgi:hypothetical protein
VLKSRLEIPPRVGLLLGRDRVLEIKNDRIGLNFASSMCSGRFI